MNKHLSILVSLSFSLVTNAFESPKAPIFTVEATGKTEDVKTTGDAADDPAIFVHPTKPSQSLIIGTDKHSGLSVFDLSGKRLQEFPDGDHNNVDLRYNFRFGKKDITLIGVGNRTTNTMDFYAIQKNSNRVERLSVKKLPAGLEIYGSCLYQNPTTKKLYFFVNSKDGTVIQWELLGEYTLRTKEVRRFDVGTQVEGCVADDDYQRFYIGEEDVGIWRYDAEPTSGTSRTMVDNTGFSGHLVADVEGLALYRIGATDGYVLASSQGENAFNVYKRSDNSYVGKFNISYQGKLVMDCDGIEATSSYLNLTYPTGMVVVQDGNPTNKKQSFKIVPWYKIELGLSPSLSSAPLNP